MNKLRGALRGGVACVQLRDKARSALEMIPLARAVKRICGEHNVPFIVNDRIEVALAVDADGLHAGHGDIPPELARKLLGSAKLLGISTTGIDGGRDAARKGADYVGIGPVFATPVKKGARLVPERVLRKAAALDLPSFAIGGIDLRGAKRLAAIGIRRAAVTRSVLRSRSPRRAAARLNGILKGIHDTT